ncbi:hypothetical protein NC651_036860 [Populus alba x Populus x berolinensis]|nr:hypothetical protein NC651_036860 [Populus alba x Populus x berolinensis]
MLKGTVVEKLVEETASNDQHLRHLIGICEAQRQVGETALNDTSSRSHQIIRLVSQDRTSYAFLNDSLIYCISCDSQMQKGTVVEKLVEETASNDQHLRHLIGICEAQRQVGETALNDTSSRSHQIIRLVRLMDHIIDYNLKGTVVEKLV